MRLALQTVAAAMSLAASAGAQWTTTCVRYTARIRTCSATYVAPPAPARRTPNAAPVASHVPADVDATLDEQDTVLGLWRATGVVFESAGERTYLEVRVTGTPGGIHLQVPAALRLPATAFDLARVAPMVYRGTDRARSVTIFRVVGGRAELLVSGANGDGLVTWQFDEHEPPK